LGLGFHPAAASRCYRNAGCVVRGAQGMGYGHNTAAMLVTLACREMNQVQREAAGCIQTEKVTTQKPKIRTPFGYGCG
jgi:hypothetical protein